MIKVGSCYWLIPQTWHIVTTERLDTDWEVLFILCKPHLTDSSSRDVENPNKNLRLEYQKKCYKIISDPIQSRFIYFYILHLVSPGYETFTQWSSNPILICILHLNDPIFTTKHWQTFGFIRCQHQNFLTTSLPRRGAIVSNEYSQVNWRVALAPQQVTWE